MKNIYRICGKLSLFFYIFIWYQMWHLCQYGGARSHLLMLLLGALGLFVNFILWLVSRKKNRETVSENSMKKKIFRIEIIIFVIGTIYFGGRIIYSAIPYNGALSWKIDEWMRQKKVQLEHNNFFEDGVEGVLEDLDAELDLPEELYIVNKYQMTFDETGEIKSIYTFLYGRDESGETKTYLVDYDADEDENMTVWVDGEANETYEEDLRLEPMLKILQESACEEQVKSWAENRDSALYEILYAGRRSFTSDEGLRYLSGDVDGDGTVSGINGFAALKDGGEVIGFEVSLHIPAEEDVIPVRYMMEPEYISVEELNKEEEVQQVEGAKDAESWTVDNSDGTMYFFLNDTKGWRLVVTDAAAGSRYYELEKTEDGGATWEKINVNPFDSQLGTAEGMIYFDENFGFAGLTGASQSASQLYVTRDGGVTFIKVELPMDTVTELPELADECGFTVEDYDYLEMPKQEGDVLTIRVLTGAGEVQGVLFQSQDAGATWVYAGITEE